MGDFSPAGIRILDLNNLLFLIVDLAVKKSRKGLRIPYNTHLLLGHLILIRDFRSIRIILRSVEFKKIDPRRKKISSRVNKSILDIKILIILGDFCLKPALPGTTNSRD